MVRNRYGYSNKAKQFMGQMFKCNAASVNGTWVPLTAQDLIEMGATLITHL